MKPPNNKLLIYGDRICQLKGLRTQQPEKRADSKTQRTPKFSLQTVNRTLEPNGDFHFHLGTNETMTCFMETSVKKQPMLPYDPQPVKATRIYKEVNAPRGYIVGEFTSDANRMRKMSQKLNREFRCKVRTYRFRETDEYCCAISVRAPRGRYVMVKIMESTGMMLRLYDSRHTRHVPEYFNAAKDNVSGTILFIGSSDTLTLIQTVTLNAASSTSRFVLRFQTLASRGLQVKRTAFNRGVVQTPSFHEHTFLLTPFLDHWAYVSEHSADGIMVSSPSFVAMKQCVALHAADKQNRTLAIVCPRHYGAPRVSVYSTTLLLVHLYSIPAYVYSYNDAGFGLYFSFHNESSLPSKLSNNLWNCSVPYRADLLYHTSCNMEVECQDAVDEVDCTYTSDLCGHGYLALEGACYSYLRRPKMKISSFEAAKLCSERGDRLAVLNSVEKWTSLVRVLAASAFSTVDVHVGIQNAPITLPLWYTTHFQWDDGTTAFYLLSIESITFDCRKRCGIINMDTKLYNYKKGKTLYLSRLCKWQSGSNVLCEKILTSHSELKGIPINGTNRWPSRDTAYVKCPLGHYTHQFLSCDVKSSCWYHDPSSYCESSLSSLPPYFTCASQMEREPYTLVCDHRVDCTDGSDEDFCSVPECRGGQFSCGNRQCIQSMKFCDGWEDCHNGEDEAKCSSSARNIHTFPPPALVKLSNRGRLVVTSLSSNNISTERKGTCPDTHFQCPENGYCLPVLLRCNGVYDCPGREDEVQTSCNLCPGFYRCRASSVCIPYTSLCDGHSHCKQHDDELICDLNCPPLCVCRGMEFVCTQSLNGSSYPGLRFLDATGSATTPAHFSENYLLVHLILANCGLTTLDEFLLPNLLILDVEDNQLSSLRCAHLVDMPQLRELSVAGNPLTFQFENTDGVCRSVIKLDLSRVVTHVLNVTKLSAFPNLHLLNLSHSGVQRVQGDGFHIIEQLQVIDLRGCPMTWFPRDLFHGLKYLHAVHAHSFKMCCPAVLPLYFKQRNCFAPSNELSSCDDLLHVTLYRVFVFVLSLLAVIGNSVSFIYRTFVSKRNIKLGYGNFVTHLSVSDFLMGVYLAIIGVADQWYHGEYVWNDVAWKHSNACKLAGFLSLLSSEVSALIMCLITIDRFLVLRYPFSKLHFSSASAHTTSLFVWIFGVLLVSVPLLPVTSHWEFYSQTGICLPLPITMKDFPGQDYSFGILIVFNCAVFVVISTGQLSIYWSVRANSMSLSNSTKKSKDLTIARRLITVAMTDFFCWFPICVLGLLASSGVPVPGWVNVTVAIFVLPLNSSVNPCLYTINVILERRSRAREEKLRALIMAQLKARN